MNLKNIISKYWSTKPLLTILVGASAIRLLSVVFSKGFGMLDDHFLIIESAQSWVDGFDYNNWIPSITKTVSTPTGHPLFYAGLHYLLFSFLQFLGITDPQTKMYFVRFVHAVYSLAIIYFGYKITLRLSTLKAAKTVGLLLAFLWFMPFMSVRNLIEFVCIPPLMYATWLVIKNEGKHKWIPYLFVGFLLGLAFNIRFQTVTFLFGFGMSLLLLKKWKESALILLGFAICIALVQAGTDMIVWKKPFMELTEYIRYNLANAETYGTQKWYNYILLIAGIFLPPISIFLIFGFFFAFLKNWRRYLLIFLPTLVFFAAHSYFPNKQERFIFPALPFIILLGTIGWYSFAETSRFWAKNTRLHAACWIFFWSLNLFPLLFISSAYSKRSRVEAMCYLSAQKDLRYILIEESQHEDFIQPPLFYLKRWCYTYYITKNYTLDSLQKNILTNEPRYRPNYVVFNGEENINQRTESLKRAFPKLEYMTTIQPGLIDNILHKLNHHNANYVCYIYKTND